MGGLACFPIECRNVGVELKSCWYRMGSKNQGFTYQDRQYARPKPIESSIIAMVFLSIRSITFTFLNVRLFTKSHEHLNFYPNEYEVNVSLKQHFRTLYTIGHYCVPPIYSIDLSSQFAQMYGKR